MPWVKGLQVESGIGPEMYDEDSNISLDFTVAERDA